MVIRNYNSLKSKIYISATCSSAGTFQKDFELSNFAHWAYHKDEWDRSSRPDFSEIPNWVSGDRHLDFSSRLNGRCLFVRCWYLYRPLFLFKITQWVSVVQLIHHHLRAHILWQSRQRPTVGFASYATSCISTWLIQLQLWTYSIWLNNEHICVGSTNFGCLYIT